MKGNGWWIMKPKWKVEDMVYDDEDDRPGDPPFVKIKIKPAHGATTDIPIRKNNPSKGESWAT